MQRQLLRQVDWFLTSVELKSDIVQSRYSWRIGQWARTSAQAVHEFVWRVGQRLGWTGVDFSFVSNMRAQIPKGIPRYPSFFLPSDTVSQRATALLRRTCILDGGGSVPLDQISWHRDPFGDISSLARLLFHSLDWVRELLDAYRLSGSPDYLYLAQELTHRWVAECLYSEQTENVWSDHGTGLRAVILCQLWAACREEEPENSPFLRDLLTALVRHAERLSHELFYRPEHNHGVTQAYALFTLALYLPVHPTAELWLTLGRSRLEQQMVDNISPEGLHREHSPYYHFYVFQHFSAALALAQAYTIEFSSEFTQRLDLMLVAGSYCLKPNKLLPTLGDTSRASSVLVDVDELQPWATESLPLYSYSSTQGSVGYPPKTCSVFCPEAGYAFLRSGWGTLRDFAAERYLALRTGTFDTSHIHRDVFSFELYAYGEDLIVDSGGPFAYKDPLRSFFVSSAAHNLVTVDGKDQAIGQAEILRWHTSPEYDLLDAQHRLYPGVVHRRTVVFIKPDYFLIIDRLEAQHSHQYSQLFHLSPALDVQQEDLSIATVHPTGGPTVRILPLWQQGVTLQLHRGETTPHQGWVCVGERQMIPNTVAEYRQTGTTVTFATLLVPEAPGTSTPITGACEGIPLQQEACFHISVGGRCEKIVFLPTGQVILKKGRHDVR